MLRIYRVIWEFVLRLCLQRLTIREQWHSFSQSRHQKHVICERPLMPSWISYSISLASVHKIIRFCNLINSRTRLVLSLYRHTGYYFCGKHFRLSNIFFCFLGKYLILPSGPISWFLVFVCYTFPEQNPASFTSHRMCIYTVFQKTCDHVFDDKLK